MKIRPVHDVEQRRHRDHEKKARHDCQHHVQRFLHGLADVRIWTPPRLQSVPISDREVRLLTYIRPLTAAPI